MPKIPYNKRKGYERYFRTRPTAEQYVENKNAVSRRYHYRVENVEVGKYAIYKSKR